MECRNLTFIAWQVLRMCSPQEGYLISPVLGFPRQYCPFSACTFPWGWPLFGLLPSVCSEKHQIPQCSSCFGCPDLLGSVTPAVWAIHHSLHPSCEFPRPQTVGISLPVLLPSPDEGSIYINCTSENLGALKTSSCQGPTHEGSGLVWSAA